MTSTVTEVHASYEELRAAALDILAGRETTSWGAVQYENLANGVAEVLARRSVAAGRTTQGVIDRCSLGYAEAEDFLDVFWDLFRQGIITLGSNAANKAFPFFRLSRAGKRILENQETYFFHDVSSYTSQLRQQVPDVADETVLYVGESLQAFRSGCILSSSVMLGVACESEFLTLVEAAESSPAFSSAFRPVSELRAILPKVNKFRNILELHLKQLPKVLKEDLDTQFMGILSIIRTFRNESGHPTGNVLPREQAYVLLNLFIPYCKKVHQLRTFFRSGSSGTS